MQAIQITESGGPEVVKIAQVDKPKPEAGEVLIQVKAAGINPVDLLITSGNFPMAPPLPFTPGFDGAGIIAEVGEGVTKWKKGDKVWFYQTRTGAFAEYTACSQKNVGHLPEKCSFEQGSAIGIPYNTAYRALFYSVNAKAGELVLIHGASGAVGIACAQLAYGAGLTVWGTASTDEGTETLKKMHVEKVFNHRKKGYVDEIKAATGGKGVDIVIEMLASTNLGHDMALAKISGRIAVIGSKGTIEIDPFGLMMSEIRIIGTGCFFATEEQQKESYAGIDRGLDIGYVNPVVGKTIPLKDAHLAFKELGQESGRKGKISLIP